MNECTTFPSPALCLNLTQHARDPWLSLCPPWLHHMDQVFRRTLSTDVHGSSLLPQCSPQIWTPAWLWEPGARILGSGQDAQGSCPALVSVSQPSRLHLSISETAQLSQKPSPQPRLPCSPSPQNAHSIETCTPGLCTCSIICWTSIDQEDIICSDGYIRETRTGAQKQGQESSCTVTLHMG